MKSNSPNPVRSSKSKKLTTDGRLWAGLLALLTAPPICLAAQTGSPQAPPPVAAPAATDARNALWIQDRFTGDTLLTSVPAEPDTSLWNPSRVDQYKRFLEEPLAPPLGILLIDSVGLEVPVYNGAAEPQLNRGAGRIPGTGLFYGGGNLAISSHRDGFFRVLKDIAVGDEIRLLGVSGEEVFRVTDLSIVHKSADEVLRAGSDRQLTLVTCHPFYFVGNAPDRFIVRALPTATDGGP